MFKEQNYNLYASKVISLNRSLPDARSLECRSLVYDRLLPETSIIIIFYNEELPTILRTVMSIINRSPRALLKEIILVDDNSDKHYMTNVLEQFVLNLPVSVKIIRSDVRIGLIRARLLGARHATGSVLTFLDSHIEVNYGWLEPLLHRIANDRSSVVCPIIDHLNFRTLSYQLERFKFIGTNWNLIMDWDPTPWMDFSATKKNTSEPFNTPMMVGCAFSIDRSFFYEIGSYDAQMDIWGGENLEMSLRVRMSSFELDVYSIIPIYLCCCRFGNAAEIW